MRFGPGRGPAGFEGFERTPQWSQAFRRRPWKWAWCPACVRPPPPAPEGGVGAGSVNFVLGALDAKRQSVHFLAGPYKYPAGQGGRLTSVLQELGVFAALAPRRDFLVQRPCVARGSSIASRFFCRWADVGKARRRHRNPLPAEGGYPGRTTFGHPPPLIPAQGGEIVRTKMGSVVLRFFFFFFFFLFFCFFCFGVAGQLDMTKSERQMQCRWCSAFTLGGVRAPPMRRSTCFLPRGRRPVRDNSCRMQYR